MNYNSKMGLSVMLLSIASGVIFPTTNVINGVEVVKPLYAVVLSIGFLCGMFVFLTSQD